MVAKFYYLCISWFHGFLTPGESEVVLSGRAPGTFLVRFSASRVTNFVVSYVPVSGLVGVEHILIETASDKVLR